jgi:L-fucose mutarotase
MLKNVDPLLTPRLLAVLAEMGHGDAVAIVDRNFPAYAHGDRVIDLPGVDSTTAARAVLSVLPVDTFETPAVFHMRPVDGSPAGPAFSEFQVLLNGAEARDVDVAGLDRFEFYKRCQQAYCVLATGDSRPYACFLLVKGVVAGNAPSAPGRG